MDKFQRRLKFIDELKVNTDENIKKKIDNKIGDGIAKFLFDMMQKTSDEGEKKQILDRMMKINNLFKVDFDEEINILNEYKKANNKEIESR